MFEVQKQQIDDYRENLTLKVLLWVLVKLALSFVIIQYVDYGVYIVIGYLLYDIDMQSSMIFINSQEVDLHLNMINQRMDAIDGKGSDV